MNMKDGADALNKIADLLSTLVQSFGPRIEREGYFEHPKRLSYGLLSNSNATLYTAPSAPPQGPPPKVKVTELHISNVDSSTQNITLYFVPNGGSAGDSTTILGATPIPANSWTRIEMETILEASETIQGFASVANKLAVRVSGIELLVGLNT